MKKLPAILASVLLATSFVLWLAPLAQAETSDQVVGVNVKLDNPFKVGGNLYDLAKAIVNDIVLPIGAVVAVLAFIWSGFRYVTAQGDAAKVKDASRNLLYVAIGTAVLLGAWVIANVIGGTVNQLL